MGAERGVVVDRFLAKVEKTEGCWNWIGCLNRPDGYGRFWIHGKDSPAHRVSWELFKGEIPRDLKVLHKCDNPKCVRPEHLFTGTMADNNLDRDRKGRAYSKITGQEADQIRDLYRENVFNQQALAEIYGICKTNISRIINNKAWKITNYFFQKSVAANRRVN